MATVTLNNGALVPMNHEAVTVDATAGGVALTASKYKTTSTVNISDYAIEALMTVETAPIRWTINGTAPTSSVGHLANAGDVITISGLDAITNFRAIRTGGTSGTIMVTYFKR